MSEEITPSNPNQPSQLATAVSETIPVPPKEFGYTDHHTATNTPLKRPSETLNQTVRVLEDNDLNRSRGYTTIFVGNSKEDQDNIEELVGTWVSLNSIRDSYNNGKINKSMLNAVEGEWNLLCESKFPGIPPRDMEAKAADLYRYLQNTSDPIMMRTKMMHEEVGNTYRASDNITMREITGQIPSAVTKASSLSEDMARGGARLSNSPYLYSVQVRNSFLKFQFSRGHKSEAALLINEINATIRGYVRTVGGNSLLLSTIAGYRAVWNWLVPQIISSSVDGIADYNDLARVIRFRDMEVILAAILCSFEDDETSMDLRCYDLTCDWTALEKINPALLVRTRPTAHTDEELAILGNIFNGTVRYTVKQLLEIIEKSTCGVESRYVYNESETIRLTMGSTSLAEAFQALDYMVTQVDPQITSARTTIADQASLEAQIGIILRTLGGCEFLHWVTEFTFMPKPDSGDEPRVIKRREADQLEFNKGLRAALKDDYLDKQVTRFVYTTAPYMTKTFIGIRNCKCPKCGKGAEEADGRARNLGYTPIDIFMTFFTHTQFMLVSRAEMKTRNELEARS